MSNDLDHILNNGSKHVARTVSDENITFSYSYAPSNMKSTIAVIPKAELSEYPCSGLLTKFIRAHERGDYTASTNTWMVDFYACDAMARDQRLMRKLEQIEKARTSNVSGSQNPAPIANPEIEKLVQRIDLLEKAQNPAPTVNPEIEKLIQRIDLLEKRQDLLAHATLDSISDVKSESSKKNISTGILSSIAGLTIGSFLGRLSSN